MGSKTELPDASSPELRLVFPTEDEKVRTWTLNHVEWGGALSLEDYLAREPFLATIPLAENGGMRYWILTDSSAAPGSRPVLASCETLRKKVLVTDPKTGEVREDIAYGIASVYTDPPYRGRRYASRMLQELGRVLGEGFEELDGQHAKPAASALWSDIGKSFYAKLGWAPCPSLHVSFAVPATAKADESQPDSEIITYDNLESFCKSDEELMRKRLSGHARDGKPQIAFAPNYDIIRWHLYRGGFIADRVFKGQEQTPAKGAVAGAHGKRVWAIWTRNYRGDGEDAAKNTMYILRLVVEDESASQEELVSSFGAVMHKAQSEARQWRLGKIELWNPSPVVDVLIKKSGLDHDIIERQKDSIPSLMWYGEEDTQQVDWVANEKFCWC
ncbi:hypothetical protein BKA67DRAFT_12557 [Truncatella angustata]|uniref:LYC1 C-terminal domain-containing protein n=1 Tax=Truncatella angustata TaxID=152316 RepID=A0A9P9A3Z4_9PEZI|nr:uncharacterized protein BKA67DRAFT_12557 [Truncatella angustata]KAH6659389.1 hypothetical protein BKA67DRAFT_12557 [Truncatella angustata]KAH8205603.1 hypothetical protein TruAng_000309 [Truncatella angustata]